MKCCCFWFLSETKTRQKNFTLIFNQRKKKMSISEKISQRHNVNSYLPAVLKENKSGWIVEYYVVNPQTELLARKKIKLNRVVSRYNRVSDARKHITGIINNVNQKLAGGWNPFFENEDARMFEKLSDAANAFLSHRKKELRKNTIRSYESFIKIFTAWTSKSCPDIYASVFSQNHAIRYMDDLFAKQSVGATTYNNHIKMARALFNWLKERCYTKQNPFDGVKPKPKPKKSRTIIPFPERKKLYDYYINEKPHFVLIMYLIYNSLIRPNELVQLQIKHLSLDGKYIKIPGEIAKNHNLRFAAITQETIDLFRKLNYERFPLDYYLFSSDLTPDKEPAGAKRYGKEWDKARKKLHLPSEMQLYSLRDTGIFEMLKSGIDDLSVMQHADHSSLEMTTIYAKHHDPNLINLIHSKSPKF